MPESAATRILTEAKALELFEGLLINPKNAPYNAKFDGVTNDTAALQAAFNHGGFVNLPAGTAIIDGDLTIPSYTHVVGRGEDLTVLKIKDAAPWVKRGIIFPAGTTQASLRGLTVDGNIANRPAQSGGDGGIYGTNVSIVNSTYIRVNNVKSINAAQHCFDVTTPYYGDAGDGAIIPNPSEFVWVTDCYASGHGDDGYTTHGSGKIWFTRCVAYGTYKAMLGDYFNTNGFEFDDYSYDVTATDCYAAENSHGFEVKAHGNMSAARNVRLIGCIAERNETNFSLRHIGHHSALSPAQSLTAKNVQLIGCTSMFPRRVFFGPGSSGDVEDIPDDQTPAGKQYYGLAVGAFRGVTVTNFHHIGDPSYDYAGSVAILVHFRAEDFILDGYHIEGHTTGNWDIYCTGGNQPAKNVTISNGVHRDSAIGGISCGGESNARINNIILNRTVAGSPNRTGIRAYGQKTVRATRFATPYSPNYNISDVLYSAYETPTTTNVPA